MTVYTIGHSTRSIDDFINILDNYHIDILIDVRSIPFSKHNPQYNKHSLEVSLRKNDIEYVHMDVLGGFRNPTANSINSAWKNKRFRGYADHMQTKEFKSGIKKVIKLAKNNNIVLMCSEAMPWRCHRSLISDALIMYGVDSYDIYNLTTIKKHKMTEFATIQDGDVIYPLKN